MDNTNEFDELNQKAENGELTQESLQQQLNAYSQAMREEFEVKTKNLENEADLENHTRDFFRKNIHASAAQIVWLASNAFSESTRLAAAKYVVSEALTFNNNHDDPIKRLLADLTANPKRQSNYPSDTYVSSHED